MSKPGKDRRKRNRLVVTIWILALAMLIVTVRLVQEIGQERTPGERFTVVRVIDGDTVELMGGDRLRLLAIDTPENGELFHNEATQFLRKLTLGKKLRIEFDRKRRDRYGRLLGYLYVDTVFVNRAILENGLGYLYLFKDNDPGSRPVRELLRAQRRALDAHVGLWSVDHAPEPYYVATQGSFRFHRPSCNSVRNLKPGRYRVFESRDEPLREGLSPCRNCKP